MITIRCEKCEKTMSEEQFYMTRSRERLHVCKKCLTMHMDAFNPETFTWALEKLDVPYVPVEWNVVRDKKYSTNPKSFSTASVFGTYLAKMKLKQYKDAGWADSERLTAESEEKNAKKKDEQAERDLMYQNMYLNGSITENEYKTLVSVAAQKRLIESNQVDPNNPYLGPNNPFDENKFLDKNEMPDIAAHLTAKDKIYLATKWGRLYEPEEWVALERFYTEMISSFDIQDADTINTLIFICKTNLKMNQCVDNNDIEGYQKLSKVYESLRKSAKFTAAQNKEKKEGFVDSIGELVSLCEREGFIPRYVTDIPQDKVDQTLKDQKDYIYKLVTKDLGFGQQIESALKKIEIQRQLEEEERQKALMEEEEEESSSVEEEVRAAENEAELNEQIEREKEQDNWITAGGNKSHGFERFIDAFSR